MTDNLSDYQTGDSKVTKMEWTSIIPLASAMIMTLAGEGLLSAHYPKKDGKITNNAASKDASAEPNAKENVGVVEKLTASMPKRTLNGSSASVPRWDTAWSNMHSTKGKPDQKNKRPADVMPRKMNMKK